MNYLISLFKKHNFLYYFNQKQSFKTTLKVNAVPPIFWFFVKPISKIGALLAGRFVKY
jgi:hypothetical protein